MTTLTSAFSGGVAVITGAGSGIGAGFSRHTAAAGMRVVLADIATDRIQAVAEDIRSAGGTACAITMDATKVADWISLAEQTWEMFGEVRLLINNAGMESVGNIWDIPLTAWEKLINLNVMGVVHGVRAFVPRMIAAGEQAYVANISSVGGLGLIPGQTPYIMSKHAVLAFTECLSLELQLLGAPISVSAVLPGPVSTRIFLDAPTDGKAESSASHRAIMEEMLRTEGLAPDDAAKLILEGIAARRFWVSCHPEMMAEFARRRAATLAELIEPELTDRMRQIVGQ